MPPASRKIPALMFMGTGSDVGKSVLVAGLCRVFARQGLKVKPFKPQNMSNNAAVTQDGGEIGRAQALQAYAAGCKTMVHMNPILLKPESDSGSQVIVQGSRWETLKARDYFKKKSELLPKVMESFEFLSDEADLILVEGAGSPAEINLRAGDIANMGFAEAAKIPVILIGDIERGGVIASLVGTKHVLTAEDAHRIKGFIVNRFRGDVSLFDQGRAEIEQRTGWQDFGVVGYFPPAKDLPAEDSLGLSSGPSRSGAIKIAVPELSRIANFDDLDPLRLEPDVELVIVRQGDALPGDADLVLLSGSKSTIGDLANFRVNGWDIDLAAHMRRGGRVIGLCGGYQMLGKTISDPQGIEGPAQTVQGLGYLEVDTVLTPKKRTELIDALHLGSSTDVTGYEIHVGRTDGPDRLRPMFSIAGEAEGAQSEDGKAMGTYLHGLFQADAFRAAFLKSLGATSGLAYGAHIARTLDLLADHLERQIDTEALLNLARKLARSQESG